MLENTRLALALSMEALLHSECGEDDGHYSDYDLLNVYRACAFAWKWSKNRRVYVKCGPKTHTCLFFFPPGFSC